MINNIKSITFIAFALLFSISSCKKVDKTFGDLTGPEKPVIDIIIAGKTTALPFGDGTGKVTITITSANAISYKIDFGDGGTSATSTVNTITHTYSHIGVKPLTITAIASGKAGISSTATASIQILKNYVPTSELVTMLTNDGTKIWTVDSISAGHFGVGPSATFISEWWSAAPNDKAGLGIYDDEYTFSKTGNIFSHKTNGSLFGHKDALKDFDPSLSGGGDFTLTGSTAANYSEGFAYDGDGTTEYIIFSNKGHMGLYIASHKYQVLTKTATQMWLRYIGNDGNAWYVKIKAK
jgi:hypothetical protein